jgi:hypothetical protein
MEISLMMKKRTIGLCGCLLMAVLFTAGASWAKDKVKVTSSEADTIITVDGLAGDWPESSLRYFPDQEAVIGVANDSTRLYLLVRFRDEKWVRAVSVAGLKWEFKGKGDSAQTVILRYRSEMPAELRHSGHRRSYGNDTVQPAEFDPMHAQADRRTFTCSIADRIEEKEIPTDGAEGPAAAFAIDQGLYTYEFSVPLAKGAVRYYGLGISQEDRLTVKATWGDMSEMRNRMHDRGDRPEGGMGGGPPGGMPGGMGGGMGGGRPGGGRHGEGMGHQRPEMPEKQELTLQIDFGQKKK